MHIVLLFLKLFINLTSSSILEGIIYTLREFVLSVGTYFQFTIKHLYFINSFMMNKTMRWT